MRYALIAILCTLTSVSPAISQDTGTGPALGFTLRGGVSYAPDYFGSENASASFAPGFGIGYIRLGGIELGSPDFGAPKEGFRILPSVRVIKDRKSADYEELSGLEDIDTAVELGISLGYRTANWEAFGAIRQGFLGHEGTVGELGVDVFARPNDKLTLRAGPRAFFGDETFADTYFGVTGSEAVASNFAEFDAKGGLMSTGVEVGATYEINESWALDGAITFHQWNNDAADSPITESDTDVRATIGITRRFTLGF